MGPAARPLSHSEAVSIPSGSRRLSFFRAETLPSFHDAIRRRLHEGLARPGSDERAQLNAALRLLAKWRSELIRNELLRRHGTRVLSGPFAGMDFLPRSAEGCHAAKLLGCYEQPLHPFVEQAVEASYEAVLNVGCAEGYYAVGLARRMPAVRVYAFDLDARAREACAGLAEKEGVAGRVVVGGRLGPDDLAAHAGRRVLLLCDVEGAEKELLDPVASPALRGMDLIVECHAGAARLLTERFQSSHEITAVVDDGLRRLADAPAWFGELAHLDQLLATWEWRSEATPWLVMRTRPPRAS